MNAGLVVTFSWLLRHAQHEVKSGQDRNITALIIPSSVKMKHSPVNLAGLVPASILDVPYMRG